MVGFYFYTSVIQKDSCNDFSPHAIIDTRLVSQHMVRPKECAMCSWEECILTLWGGGSSKCLWIPYGSTSRLGLLFPGCFSPRLICAWESGVLLSHTIIVLLLMFFSGTINHWVIYFIALPFDDKLFDRLILELLHNVHPCLLSFSFFSSKTTYLSMAKPAF